MINPNLPFRIKAGILTPDQLENYNSSSFHRSELLFTTQKIEITIEDQTIIVSGQHVVILPNTVNRSIKLVDDASNQAVSDNLNQVRKPAHNHTKAKKIGFILSLSERYLNAIAENFITTPAVMQMMSEPNIFHYSQSNWQRISNLITRLVDEQAQVTTELEQKMVFAITTQLLLEVYRSSNALSAKEAQLNEREQLALDIKRYVEERFIQDITLSDIEEAFHISASTANRLFHQYFKSTIHQFIIDLRLQYAHYYIEKGLSISESWQKAGFNDYSNFYRAFIKHYDYKPHNIKNRD